MDDIVAVILAARDRRDWDEVLVQAERLRAAEPENFFAMKFASIALLNTGKTAEGATRLLECLKRHPDDPEVQINYGRALYFSQEYASSIQVLIKFTSSHPQHKLGWETLGLAYYRSGHYAKALDIFLMAAHNFDNDPNFMINAGQCYNILKQYDDAEITYKRALVLDPGNIWGWLNLGSILLNRFEFDRSVTASRRAVRLDPNSATTQFNFAVSLEGQGSITSAIPIYADALRLSPDSPDMRANLMFGFMKIGKFALGRRVFHHSLLSWRNAIFNDLPGWGGNQLNGQRLVLYEDQGLGDSIMYVRLATKAYQLGAGSVHLACRPAMLPLLSSLPGVDGAFTIEECVPENFDCQAPMASMMFYYPTTPEDLGAETVPYLSVSAERIARWQAALPPREPGHRLRVGVNWQGQVLIEKTPWYEGRSIAPAQLSEIFLRDDIQPICLQKDQVGETLGSLESARRLVIPKGMDSGGDGAFLDTAAVMAHCDLVITTDTAVAHLAGALGRPTWVLLTANPEWRWGVQGERMPWYPTMRLFRQPRRGDWHSVMRAVDAALTAHVRDGDPLIPVP